MNRHPGGKEHTLRMLHLGGLPAGARILDMGAGAGEAVRMMREQGYAAEGIDLQPHSEAVRKGDFLQTAFPDNSFDGVLSQCAFFVSGNPAGAVREACRILKPDGVLMLSDVFFSEPELPGFLILHEEDMTPEWQEYYFGLLWEGERFDCDLPKGKCRYCLLIAKKE